MKDYTIIYSNKESMILSTYWKKLEYNFECFPSIEETLRYIDFSNKEKTRKIPLVIIGKKLIDGSNEELLYKLYEKYPGLLTILIGDDDKQIIVKAFNQTNLFRYIFEPVNEKELFLFIKDAIQKYEKEKEKQNEIAIQQELMIAQDIQKSLLPPESPKWKDIKLVCFSKAAKEVGGDFYTYYGLQKNRVLISKHIIAVGDVTGKGVSAALLMATSLSRVEASLTMNLNLTEKMVYLDKMLLPFTKPKKQNCALCMLEISGGNTKNPIAKVINAGLIPPYIKKANGEIEWTQAKGFALGQGLGSKLGYKEVKMNISKGDTIILVSDGVIEAHNAKNEMLGFDGFEKMLRDIPIKNVHKTLENIKNKVSNFMENAEQHDDMTILVLQV